MIQFVIMKKGMKIFCWLSVGLVFFVFLFIRLAEWQLAKKLPEVIHSVSGSGFALSVGEVKQGQCWVRICLDLDDFVIKPKNHNPIVFNTVSLKIPPLWPLRADVNAIGNENWLIDGTFGKKQWDIRTIKGGFKNLDFSLSGRVNTKDETGELYLKTQGLRNFLTTFTDIPEWMGLFIQNIPQEFTLKPKDGALRFEGIPLLWFEDLK